MLSNAAPGGRVVRDRDARHGDHVAGVVARIRDGAGRFADPFRGTDLWCLHRPLWRRWPTPIYDDELFVVASGRAPERPIFVVRASARGDLTLSDGVTSSDAIVWSRSGRGSYMPTPLIYKGLLYVLANNGVLDAYNLETGAEIYRQRLPQVGNGFSASPVAADGKIYISSEDGEMLVIAAGPNSGTSPRTPWESR